MSGGQPPPPGDPITELMAAAAQTAELFSSYVKAGMPPMYVAVMMGQMFGVMAVQGQQPDTP